MGTMLNDSDHTFLPTEEDPKTSTALISLRHISSSSSSSDECGSVPVSEEEDDKERNMVSPEKKKKKKQLIIKMPTVLLGDQLKASLLDMNEDGDEGFRTPTSSDKKIPVMISPKCPPPPRKPKSISLSSPGSSPTANIYKRKTPSTSPSKMNLPCRCRCRIRISDEEIKALFPPTFLADLGRKIKKARTTGTGFN